MAERKKAAAAAEVQPGPSWGQDLGRKGLLVLALLLGQHACGLVELSGSAALFDFFLAGLCLYLAVPKEQRAQIAALSRPPEPMQAWEPWFALALLLGGGAFLTWRYSSLPQGGIYAEGLLATEAANLLVRPDYIAHHFGTINWPTLYTYQSLFMMKVFGWSPAALRSVSLFYTMILLFGLWLSARAITSSGTAALTALLWLGFHYNIHFARRYSPVIFSAMPAVLVLGLGVAAVRRRSLPLAVGAGLAAGLGMHAYFPGRLAPMLLGLFCLLLWLRRRSLGLPPRLFAGALLACALIASPVVYALRDARYSSYVNSSSIVHATGAKGWLDVKTYWGAFKDQSQTYLKMFHVGLNHESDGQEDDKVHTPVLNDPVIRVLAPLGLVLALLGATQGASLYVIVGFLVGLLPAALSMLGPPPWPRRAVFAFPFIYLGAGLALEHLRLILTQGRLRIPSWLFLLAGAGVAVWLGSRSLAHFEDYALSPGMTQFANARGYDAAKEMRAHPDANVIASNDFTRPVSGTFLFPYMRNIRGASTFVDHLCLDPAKDNLLVMGGWNEANVPLLKSLYPHAELKVFRDERLATDKGFSDNLETIYDEFCYPGTLLVSVFVPKEDAALRWSLLKKAKGVEVPVPGSLGPQGLEALGEGPQLLGASVWFDTAGSTVTAHLGLPGWQAKIDGVRIPLDKPFRAPGGMHFVELSGRVPAKATGALPFSLSMPGVDLISAHRVFGYRFERAYKVEYYDGSEDGRILPGKKPHTVFRGVAPAIRFNESSAGSCIFVAAITGHLRPDVSGRFEIRAHWPSSSPARVWVGKTLVNDRSTGTKGGPAGLYQAVDLKAGSPSPYRVEYYSRCMTENFQGFSWEIRTPGEQDWKMLPWTWFEE